MGFVFNWVITFCFLHLTDVAETCAPVTFPVTATTTTTTTTTSASTSTTTTPASCTFTSCLAENVAAFGDNPCPADDCSTTACICTIPNGASRTASANQCPDNASFCITTTNSGPLLLETALATSLVMSCSNGVLTGTGFLTSGSVSMITKIECPVFNASLGRIVCA